MDSIGSLITLLTGGLRLKVSYLNTEGVYIMQKPVVVVPGLVRKDALAYLAEHCEIRQWQETTKMPRELLKEWLKEADGLWSTGHFRIDKDLLQDAKNLKVVAQASVGFDNIVVDELTELGIPHGNTPDVLTETVAEHTFTLIACAMRRICENMAFVTSGQWEKRPSNIKGTDLSRATLGIIGMGSIGVSVSRRARAFGMTVIYNNRKPRQDDDLYMTTYVDIDTLLRDSDVVLVTAPLTPETQYMINREIFKKMKNTALFVNVGRGKIVDTDALVEALETGEIDYAALDVTDPEPLPADHPLLKTGKVLVTPHVASFTDRCRKDMAMLTADNLIRGTRRQPLKTCVNPEVNYPAKE